MRGTTYTKITDWLNDCRRVVARDQDNIILFTGPEGEGKSTLLFQVMTALDPEFGADRAHFGIADFLSNVRPPGGHETYQQRKRSLGVGDWSVAADELEADSRASMTTLNRRFNKFLREGRGLNLHIGICFPRAFRLDQAIFEDRVRYHIHVPKRGTFKLKERRDVIERQPSGEERALVRWIDRGTFPFHENPATNPQWRLYKAKKADHMSTLGEDFSSEDVGASAASLDNDRAAINEWASRLLRR